MDSRSRYLDALGIEQWTARGRLAQRQAIPIAVTAPLQTEWTTLETQVAGCTKCPLHAGRTQTVFGVGDRRAEWMVIGEAPGAEEDARGEPFVGRAGQLLNAMLRGIGLAREQVFIANIL